MTTNPLSQEEKCFCACHNGHPIHELKDCLCNLPTMWEKKCDELSKKLNEFEHQSCPICGIDPQLVKKFIKEIIAESNESMYWSGYKKGIEYMKAELLKDVVNKKFPRGKRLWCIECAERIVKYVKSKIS